MGDRAGNQVNKICPLEQLSTHLFFVLATNIMLHVNIFYAVQKANSYPTTIIVVCNSLLLVNKILQIVTGSSFQDSIAIYRCWAENMHTLSPYCAGFRGSHLR